jgi:hypothetical protein
MAPETQPAAPRRRRPYRYQIPDPATVRRLRDEEHQTFRAIAAALGSSYPSVYRTYRALPAKGTPPTALERTILTGEPSSAEPVQSSAALQAQVEALRTEVAALKAHRVEVDAWIASIQRQLRDSAVQSVQSPAVQTYDDPEDAKPERWNLWLPRGFKRRIEAQAKTTGMAPSQLVQRLLIAALNGVSREEVARE